MFAALEQSLYVVSAGLCQLGDEKLSWPSWFAYALLSLQKRGCGNALQLCTKSPRRAGVQKKSGLSSARNGA
jgi:hypothetical protein